MTKTGTKQRTPRIRLLLGLLFALAVVYVALLPKLRALQAETAKLRAIQAQTERMRRESAQQQVQPPVPATANDPAQALEAARAAVRQTPNSAEANLHLASLLLLSGAK